MFTPAPWLRTITAVFAWLAVTAVAAVGSWLGMSAVFVDPTQRPPTEVLVAQTEEPQTEVKVSPSPSPSPVPLPDTGDNGTTSSSDPSPSDTSPSSPEPTKEYDNWYQVDAETYEGTFDTQGGTATVQVRPDDAVFVSASPADGFTVDVEQVEYDRLVVYFYGETVMVSVDVMWWEGPYAEITTVS